MQNTKPKNTHGGKRKDSGFKPLYGKKMVRITVRVPSEYREWIEEKYGTQAVGIRDLIAKDMGKNELTR
jgi:hypothetical protein